MQPRRVFMIWSIFLISSAVLVGRLFLLTVFPGGLGASKRWQDQVRTRAHLEHLSGKITDDGRGQILYRSGEPVESSLSSSTVARPLVGEVGLPDEWPSATRVVAEQGRSGLELRFDTLLAGQRPGYVGVMHTPLQGDVYGSTPPVRGADIRTTLDALWQQVAERALRQAGVQRGAVLILNTHTNEVLAMASRSTASPYENVAVQAAAPGSIFKLITAAAAYESYRFVPDSTFFCPGYANLPGVVMRCWRVHGKETLRDAIAESCDAAFAVIGSQIGRQGFETVWNRLHLSEPQLQTMAGSELLPGAEGGVLFRTAGDDNGLLANTAIGQEDVRLSPIAGANLASTIANLGRYRDVVLVKDAQREGRVGRRFAEGRSEQAFSPRTAVKLTDGMMHAVLDAQGTAHDMEKVGIRVAVKTGTAELPNGRVNAWMIGFAPVKEPQFAFCVVDEDVPSSRGHTAVHEVVKRLLEQYRQFPPTPDIR